MYLIGIGKIWYREKVSEPVSEKFVTGTDFRWKNLGILKIYNGSRYQEFFIFLVVSAPVAEKFGTGKKSRNRYRSNLVSEKCLGTGIGKIWYRKKYRYRYRKYSVPEKSIGIDIVQHFGYCHTLIWALLPNTAYLLLPKTPLEVVGFLWWSKPWAHFPPKICFQMVGNVK